MKSLGKCNFGFLICVLLTLSACVKENHEENYQPQNFKKDIFNCVIDGKRWDPAGSISGFVKAYIIESDANEYFVTLSAGSLYKYMNIHLSGVRLIKGTGRYLIDKDIPLNIYNYFVDTKYPDSFCGYDDGFVDDNNFQWHVHYFTSARYSGEVYVSEFTMEPAKNPGTYHGYIGGTFKFKAFNVTFNNSVTVEDGNFRIEYWR